MTVVKRANAQELGASATTWLDIYLFLQILPGHFLLPLLAGTFLFSKTAVRHATLINVVIIFIFTDIVSCFLLYAGKTTGPQPSQTLCIAQLSLLNGLTAAWAVSISMLVLNIWFTFKRLGKVPTTPALKYAMVAAPYFAMTVFTIAAGALSVHMPDRVSRDRRFFYCSIEFDPFSSSLEGFQALVCLITLGFEIHLGVTLWRNWQALKRAGMSSGLDYYFLLRVFVFGVYVLLGMIVSAVMIFSPQSVFPDMYAASIGLVVFLVFGTQRDVMHVWCFWSKPKNSQEQDKWSDSSSIPEKPVVIV
ncbi:hypothetical protein PUNSTDRAFT_111132 [Punctularia strigosozonata HHB-11173 SS5]|uniref:uncharacterized protein n=1 Tax=Punctularia strigosozonata (strain HHB-11173) TaxID=741275 RepID=UPI00044186B9|nr:uncharacterized protein PUNSTDRAFT_111132 [Punctularia strigosozonata HHB-11173 SS5]EIN12736.1 hypothetical protein PUNSTDRAFT_111132 [Punctularia strigosozonata HHB-11173 SS5]